MFHEHCNTFTSSGNVYELAFNVVSRDKPNGVTSTGKYFKNLYRNIYRYQDLTLIYLTLRNVRN